MDVADPSQVRHGPAGKPGAGPLRAQQPGQLVRRGVGQRSGELDQAQPVGVGVERGDVLLGALGAGADLGAVEAGADHLEAGAARGELVQAQLVGEPLAGEHAADAVAVAV